MSTSSRLVTGIRPGTACHLASSACTQAGSKHHTPRPMPLCGLRAACGLRLTDGWLPSPGTPRGPGAATRRARAGPVGAGSPFAGPQAGAPASSASIGRSCTPAATRESPASRSGRPPCLHTSRRPKEAGEHTPRAMRQLSRGGGRQAALSATASAHKHNARDKPLPLAGSKSAVTNSSSWLAVIRSEKPCAPHQLSNLVSADAPASRSRFTYEFQ